jgi:hypothetical protein
MIWNKAEAGCSFPPINGVFSPYEQTTINYGHRIHYNNNWSDFSGSQGFIEFSYFLFVRSSRALSAQQPGSPCWKRGRQRKLRGATG